VPAQAMHSRKPRRSMPSRWWSWRIRFDIVVPSVQTVRRAPVFPGIFGPRRESIEWRSLIEPQAKLKTFEALMLPHLDAAHNLARWLARGAPDAEDIVQESYLRAFRFFD